MDDKHRPADGPRTLTRRDFLSGLAGLTGGAAVQTTLEAWSLARPSPAPPPLTGSGAGTRVLILGAGLAGLTAAYELTRLGYDCRLLEARDRAGGRCWTVRQGDRLDELNGERQVCTFDEGLYFNPGPWRIPHTHASTLHYCREFGVAVEVFVNDNQAAYAYSEGTSGPLAGRPVRLRTLRADLYGHTAELLAKTADRASLDQPLTATDLERLRDYLAAAGALDRGQRYTGSTARGYRQPPGAGEQPGALDAPLDLTTLLPLASRLAAQAPAALAGVAPAFFQMTMLHPVGGMDQLARGFGRALGDRITYQAVVRAIRQTPTAVSVIYDDLRAGTSQQVSADYCICTLPLSVLRDIPSDLSRDMLNAIGAVAYAATGKIGLQMSRRFWEEDEGIYGGLTYTDLPTIGTIGYPSSGYLTRKGVLLGYYNFGAAAVEVGRLTPAARTELALRHGRQIHPAYRDAFERAFSVAWQRVPYSRGGWATLSASTQPALYRQLSEPDGRLYLAGEHLSHLPAWLAGAIESAWVTLTKVHQRVQTGTP